MQIKNLMSAVAILAVLAWFVMPAQAVEKATVRTGYLTCNEAGGWGLILGSSHGVHCTCTSNKHRTEYYTGTISSSAPTSVICVPP